MPSGELRLRRSDSRPRELDDLQLERESSPSNAFSRHSSYPTSTSESPEENDIQALGGDVDDRVQALTSSSSLTTWRSGVNAVIAQNRMSKYVCSPAYAACVEQSFQRQAKRVPKFGDLQFPNTGLMTRFCILSHKASEEAICEKVVKNPSLFDLDAPKLILSIYGGANLSILTREVKDHFSRGLVGAAKQTGGWVITGGTDSGVMDLVGQAMHQHDARRVVPCIGVASFGALKSAWRKVLDGQGVEELGSVTEAPQLTKEDMDGQEKGLAGLQQHHTHCILCDSGGTGKDEFGKELDVRERLEQHVASGRFDNRDDPTPKTAREVLRVMILVNGGPISFKGLKNAIDNRCPVVVCRDSGRAADFIASLRTEQETDADSLKKAWEKYGIDNNKSMAECLAGLQMVEKDLWEIVKSPCLSVYTTEDRLEDVIACAVIERIFAQHDETKDLGEDEQREEHRKCQEELKSALNLTVRWQCAKPKVILRLLQELAKDNIGWILERFIEEWRENDAGLLMRWLLNNHLKDVKDFHHHTGRCTVKMHQGHHELGHLERLFLWLVENQASPAVVDELWLHMDYPVHAALAAASSCRQTADSLQATGSYEDGLCSNNMRERGDRYEDLAIRVLAEMDRIDPLEYLFQRSERWGNHHLVSLAHLLECKQFVSQPFYNFAVDTLWQTPTPFAVFALDKDRDIRSEQSILRASMWDIIRGAYFLRRDRLSMRDFWSVPRVKALTHGISRMLFILIYSYFVLFSTGPVRKALSFMLFLWGIALALVEVLQFKAAAHFSEYITVWNALDFLLLFFLLCGLVCGWTLVPWLVPLDIVQAVHALNLLPCYLRLLQVFELSEYFGTLLFTVFGMARDTSQFLVLHGIMSLGFSCALTPILFPKLEDRVNQGVTWGFWAIFGEQTLDNETKELPRWLGMLTSFMKYLLYLTSNVLLVNLLVAMLNDTYVAYKDESKREWAFKRVDAVMEFASPEAHILPPPLDLFLSLRSLSRGGRPISLKLPKNGCRSCFTPIVKPLWWIFCSSYCVVEKVVPLGARKVKIQYKAVGGSKEASVNSLLRWEDSGDRSHDLRRSGSHLAAIQGPTHNLIGQSGGKNGQPSLLLGELVYEHVNLTKPLYFRYGSDGDGFREVRIHLDEDLWKRTLRPFEIRALKALQKRVLVASERVSSPDAVEEQVEAKLTAFDERLSSCTEELVKVRGQLSEVLTLLKASDASKSTS